MKELINQRFGSRKGFLRHCVYFLVGKLGMFRKFSAIEATKYHRIVFICSGNICRSPLAEAYAQSLGREAASCGLDCRNGFPVDPRANDFAKEAGLSLEGHLTCNIDSFQFRPDDLIVVMEPSHIWSLRGRIGDGYTLALAGSYCSPPIHYIHDPYSCDLEYFKYCETKVIESVRAICA